MQLAMRRSRGNTEVAIICQIRLTEEERELVEIYNLYNTTLWGTAPRAGYNLADFMRGVTISERVVTSELSGMSDVRSLFYLEDQLMKGMDNFYEGLNRGRSIRQEAIIEFPRKDDTVNVRVKK